MAGRRRSIYAAQLTTRLGGARIYLKREDLAHTGAHKINNALGQGLLAQRMGKRRIIAETGAGQHGVAAATVCAMLGLQCIVYMGAEDIERQALNVLRMKLMGAEVRPVHSGTATLKDAINEAMRDWVTNVGDTYYMFGTVAGPHPFPLMVRHFQSVIGQEARAQMLGSGGQPSGLRGGLRGRRQQRHGHLPSVRRRMQTVRLIGVEAGGRRRRHRQARRHAGRRHRPACCTARAATCCRTTTARCMATHSISAGLDYPGVGPEHAYLKDSGRATYVAVDDSEALAGLRLLSETEGIIPALETAHAVALRLRPGPRRLSSDRIVLINVSGRGDKDMDTVARMLGVSLGLEHRGGGAMIADTALRNDLDDRLAATRAAERLALVIYLTAGFPDAESTLRWGPLLAAERRLDHRAWRAVLRPAGRRADHPAIQPGRARGRDDPARQPGSGAQIRAAADAPVVLMSYCNPIFRMGIEAFAARRRRGRGDRGDRARPADRGERADWRRRWPRPGSI